MLSFCPNFLLRSKDFCSHVSFQVFSIKELLKTKSWPLKNKVLGICSFSVLHIVCDGSRLFPMKCFPLSDSLKKVRRFLWLSNRPVLIISTRSHSEQLLIRCRHYPISSLLALLPFPSPPSSVKRRPSGTAIYRHIMFSGFLHIAFCHLGK